MTAITGLKGQPEMEEAAVVVVELLRLNLLNSDLDMFPYAGAPMRGDCEYTPFVYCYIRPNSYSV